MLLALVTVPFSSEAHAPRFPSGNDSLSEAYGIDDASKSWVFYSHLDENEVRYYGLDLEDERLLIQLLVPVKETEGSFLPEIVMIIPGWSDGGPFPATVELIRGYGHKVLGSSLPSKAEYEGITATAFHAIVDIDGMSDDFHEGASTFYLAIHEPAGGEGNYALVVGHEESFTAGELLLVPFSLLQIYLWQGSGLLSVVAPIDVTMAAGTGLLYTMSRKEGVSAPGHQERWVVLGIGHRVHRDGADALRPEPGRLVLRSDGHHAAHSPWNPRRRPGPASFREGGWEEGRTEGEDVIGGIYRADLLERPVDRGVADAHRSGLSIRIKIDLRRVELPIGLFKLYNVVLIISKEFKLILTCVIINIKGFYSNYVLLINISGLIAI